MKKKLFMFALCCGFIFNTTAQVYQIPNSNFNTWGNTNEPQNGWWSFVSARTSDLAAFIAGTAVSSSKKNTTKVTGRSGAAGDYAAQLKSSSILGANANGNITSGRINMGSTTPAHVKNYNFSDIDNGYACLFAGKPDAIGVYATFSRGASGTYNARGRVYLHAGGTTFKDGIDETVDANDQTKKIAEAVINITPSTEWTYFTAPVQYTGNTATEIYALASFTTNPTPGASSGDVLKIDDFSFIYYSQLSDLKFNGATLAGFNKDAYAYEVEGMYTEGCLTYTSNGVGATVSESYNAATKIATITVKGDDISVNASNYHTYTVKFNTPTYDYADGSAFAVAPGVYNVNINRTFNAGWSTICLPFATTTAALGSGVKAQALTSTSETTLSFTGTETLEANKPYLVYFPSAVNSLSFTEVTVEELAPVAVTFGAWTFEGTYVASKPMSGLYGVAKQNGEDKILMGGTSAQIKATRAFFSTTAANVKEMGIEIDGVVTAIDNVEMAGKKTFDVYSVSGALMRQGATSLNGLHSGLYIINGKKVLVK